MSHVNNSGDYEQVNLKLEATDKLVIYGSMTYDRNICIYMGEYKHSHWGIHRCVVNTSSNDNEFNYNWNLSWNGWEDWSTFKNVFNFYRMSPSCCLGTVNNLNSVCFSPMITRHEYEGRKYILIAYNINRTAKTRSLWWLNFADRAKDNIVNILAYGDVIDKDGNVIDNLLSILAIYIDKNQAESDIYTIGYFELNKSEISEDLENPTKLITPVATKTINSTEWTDRHKLMTCGKECYGVIKAEDTDKTYIWFEGAYVLSYQNSDINDFYLSEGYKYDNDTLFLFDNEVKEWVLDEFKPSEQTYITWISEIIDAKGYAVFNVSGRPRLSGINPPLFIRGSGNSIKGIVSNPQTYNTTYPVYTVNNPNYLNYSHVKNALKCETEVELDMNVKAKDLAGDEIEMLINKDFAITDSYNFFGFNDDGSIKTAQICLTNGAALNMTLKISTDPYYFDFTTPIDYYTSEKFSLMYPIVEPVFNTINEHVLNTIETLILLRYEYI